MTFVESIQTCLRKYVDFNGRATRSEYWWWVLFNFLVLIATTLLLGRASLISDVISLAFFLPSVAVGVRRLHDIGKSGWFMLLALIPLIGALVLLYWYTQVSAEDNEYGPQPA